MKNIKKKTLVLGCACSAFIGGLFFSLYNNDGFNITHASIDPKNTSTLPNVSPVWTIENTTQQNSIKGVFVSPDGKFTLIEVKRPFVLRENQETSSKIPEIPKDKSHVILVDNRDKKILWRTPEEIDYYSPQWSPDGEEISFLTFDEQKQSSTLWVSSARKYFPRKVTTQSLPISGYLWAPNGKYLALLLSEFTAKNDEISYDFGTWGIHTSCLIVPLKLSTPQDLNQVELFPHAEYFFIEHKQEPYKVMAWSPDSQNIVFVARKNNTKTQQLFVININSKKVKVLQKGDNLLYPMYSHDGKWIAFISDVDKKEGEDKFPIKKKGVFLQNLLSDKNHLLDHIFKGEPHLIGWSAGDQFLVIQDSDKTLNKLYKLFIHDNKSEAFNRDATLLSSVSLNRSGTSIGFVGESFTISPQAFISSLKELNPHPVLSESPQSLPLRAETIQWKSFDGMEIEGILVYPHSYEEGTSYPLIVAAHDGPYNAWKQRFLGSYYESLPFSPAVLAFEGYAILLPNIRGSSNYGLDFAHANQSDLGGGDFQDIMSGVDFVIAKGIADPQKLAIWGWGYGGYLATWASIQTNRFKAAIVGSGIIDFISYTGKMEYSDLLPSYLGGNFWENKELWLSRSPIMHVEKINTPIFLLHGFLSPYSFYQGKELKYALTLRNVPVSYFNFPLEGHAFDRLSLSRKIGMELTIKWLRKFLTSSSQDEEPNLIKERNTLDQRKET